MSHRGCHDCTDPCQFQTGWYQQGQCRLLDVSLRSERLNFLPITLVRLQDAHLDACHTVVSLVQPDRTIDDE